MPALIAGLIMGGLQLGKGVYDQLKSAQIRRNNPRPQYQIPQNYYDNLNLAQSQASRGLPQQALDNYYNQQGQNQAGSINAILQSGGSPNDVNSVYGNTLNNNRQILGQDALAKDQNIKDLMTINNQFGDQLDKRFTINQYKPFTDAAQLSSAYGQSAIAGFGAGLDTISQGFAANATQNLADEYAKMGANGYAPQQTVIPQTPQTPQTPQNPYNNNPNSPLPQNPNTFFPPPPPPQQQQNPYTNIFQPLNMQPPQQVPQYTGYQSNYYNGANWLNQQVPYNQPQSPVFYNYDNPF